MIINENIKAGDNMPALESYYDEKPNEKNPQTARGIMIVKIDEVISYVHRKSS